MFKITPFPDGYELTSQNTTTCPYRLDYLIDKNCHIYQNTITSKESADALICKYLNFTPIGRMLLPYGIEFTVFDGKQNEKLNLQFSKIELNKNINATLYIPSRYKKADISLINNLL